MAIRMGARLKKGEPPWKLVAAKLEDMVGELIGMAGRVLSSEATEGFKLVTEADTDRLLLADEDPHKGRLCTLFDAGLVAIALEGDLEQGLAIPAAMRAIERVWYGGDWACPLHKGVRKNWRHHTLPGFSHGHLATLLREVAQPRYAFTCPRDIFLLERLFDFLYAGILVYTIWEVSSARGFCRKEAVQTAGAPGWMLDDDAYAHWLDDSPNATSAADADDGDEAFEAAFARCLYRDQRDFTWMETSFALWTLSVALVELGQMNDGGVIK